MSRATDLTSEIKDDLAHTHFSKAISVSRRYRPLYTIKELKRLTVTVVLSAIDQVITGRVNNLDTVTVTIVVQQQVDAKDEDAIDTLITLSEEIAEHFRDKSYTSIGANWLSTSISFPYDPDDLVNYQVFASAIELKYEIHWRAC